MPDSDFRSPILLSITLLFLFIVVLFFSPLNRNQYLSLNFSSPTSNSSSSHQQQITPHKDKALHVVSAPAPSPSLPPFHQNGLPSIPILSHSFKVSNQPSSIWKGSSLFLDFSAFCCCCFWFKFISCTEQEQNAKDWRRVGQSKIDHPQSYSNKELHLWQERDLHPQRKCLQKSLCISSVRQVYFFFISEYCDWFLWYQWILLSSILKINNLGIWVLKMHQFYKCH